VIRLRTALAFLLVVLLPITAVANGGLSLRDIAELRAVGEVAISPDGSRIAHTRVVPRELFGEQDDGPAFAELHVADARGVSRGFVTGEVNVAALDWTPDGHHVTFLAKRKGDDTRRLYRIAVDGGEAQVLASFDTDIRAYSLAPDGRRIAFVATDKLDEAIEKAKKKGFSQRIFEEEQQPFRLRIVEDGGEPRTIELEGSVQDVRWSPAGDRLAVKLAPQELVDAVIMDTRIVFIAPASGEITGRVQTPGKLGAMAWSPDGAHLGLVMAADRNDPREGRLAVVARDGDTPRDLLPGLEGHVLNLAWRDARRLVFISNEGVTARLRQIERDGRNARELLSGSNVVWETLSVSANGRIAAGGSTPQHPRELFRLGERGAERLTDSNPWLAERRLARQEIVRYRARDGLEIEGLLVRPLDEVAGQRYPLILAVHGGPEAHYSHGWLSSYALPAQAAAAQGYAMIYPNYRASTGRGVAFSKLNHGRPAKEEFDDLVDGVDHLIDLGLVDRDRVGITGGSYGGYASAWGATYYSERFAASVMFVGLSDKIAMMGTTDIPVELHDVHYLAWPWENWDLYRDASPIFHAHKSRTPTLILHGDADPRVHPTQSQSLYRYLKLLGQAPVRLVFYPGEGHGNQRAASRWDYSLRLMQWMDHYLKGEGGEPPAHAIDHKAAWTGTSDAEAETETETETEA